MYLHVLYEYEDIINVDDLVMSISLYVAAQGTLQHYYLEK